MTSRSIERSMSPKKPRWGGIIRKYPLELESTHCGLERSIQSIPWGETCDSGISPSLDFRRVSEATKTRSALRVDLLVHLPDGKHRRQVRTHNRQ